MGTTADTACAGNDSRLSNARPASDVYSWAKASSKPSYSWSEITSKPSSFTPASHTHNYAGSSSAGGSATSAVKLDSSAGSATQPVYFSGGKPVACTYTLGKSVPSNAVFTDTHYTTGLKVGASATATANAAATNGKVYLNVLDNTTVRDSHKIVGSGATTVTSDANGVITISSTDTNTTYTSLKNPYSLTVKQNGSTLTTYDGSSAKTATVQGTVIAASAPSGQAVGDFWIKTVTS